MTRGQPNWGQGRQQGTPGGPGGRARRVTGRSVVTYGLTAGVALIVGAGMGAAGHSGGTKDAAASRPAPGPTVTVTATAKPSPAPTPTVRVTHTVRVTATAHVRVTVTAHAASGSGSSGSSGSGSSGSGSSGSGSGAVAGGGATAKCVDGTLSYSAHHQGTCSHHGGVAVWYK